VDVVVGQLSSVGSHEIPILCSVPLTPCPLISVERPAVGPLATVSLGERPSRPIAQSMPWCPGRLSTTHPRLDLGLQLGWVQPGNRSRRGSSPLKECLLALHPHHSMTCIGPRVKCAAPSAGTECLEAFMATQSPPLPGAASGAVMPFATGASGPQDVDRGRVGADEQSRRGALPDDHEVAKMSRAARYVMTHWTTRLCSEIESLLRRFESR
jgi:hypothetical protein